MARGCGRPGFSLLATLVLVAACSGGDAPGRAAGAGAAAAGGPATGEKVGALAPDFTLRALDGQEVRLADSAGQVRLIDFWATWCAPCREEIPMLNELQTRYGERGLRVLAISDEEATVIREFFADKDVRYTNLVGTDEVIEAYGVLGLPSAYLIDGEGHVVDSFLGPKPRRVLVEKIESLLEPAPAT